MSTSSAASWISGLVAAALLLVSGAAQAVPSFARQTGQPCAMCHVGGFGPQLTDYGINFKLNAYTTTKGGDWIPPVAAMVITGFTHTSKSQDPSTLDGHSLTGTLKGNNNFTLDQVSLFVSGRISDHVGIFSQYTDDGIARHSSIDDVDLELRVGRRPRHLLSVGAVKNRRSARARGMAPTVRHCNASVSMRRPAWDRGGHDCNSTGHHGARRHRKACCKSICDWAFN